MALPNQQTMDYPSFSLAIIDNGGTGKFVSLVAHQLVLVMFGVPSLYEDMIQMTWLSALVLAVGCLILGFFFGSWHSARSKSSSKVPTDTDKAASGKKKNMGKLTLEVEKLADILEDFKMVLVVRNDLKMGKGKIAAQCRYRAWICFAIFHYVKEEEDDMKGQLLRITN